MWGCEAEGAAWRTAARQHRLHVTSMPCRLCQMARCQRQTALMLWVWSRRWCRRPAHSRRSRCRCCCSMRTSSAASSSSFASSWGRTPSLSRRSTRGIGTGTSPSASGPNSQVLTAACGMHAARGSAHAPNQRCVLLSSPRCGASGPPASMLSLSCSRRGKCAYRQNSERVVSRQTDASPGASASRRR